MHIKIYKILTLDLHNYIESQSIWDELKSIHILWWIIVSLMISIICLICFLLIYMRIQNSITKPLAEAHRICQRVSNKYTVAAQTLHNRIYHIHQLQ